MLARLHFLRPMLDPPLLDLTGRGGGNLKLDPRDIDLADADAQEPAPSLVTHGFAAIPFSAALPEGEADPAFRKYFANLCAVAVKRETGAAMVVGLPRTVQIRRTDGAEDEAPISVCHTDFTPTSAVRRSVEVLAGLGQKTLPRRFAAFNAWWLASTGPQDRPLAFCDASTIASADLQVGGAVVLGPDRSPMDYGEIALQRFNARSRWYWYPQLGPDRLLLFCGFDSDSSRPSMVTHSAFTNNDCPPGTSPRVSVECRCLAFW
jgi:hypothetical protein